MNRLGAAVFGLFVLAGCAVAPPGPPAKPPEARLDLVRVSFGDLPGWETDRQDEALAAFRLSCAKVAALPPDQALTNGGALKQNHSAFGRAGDWQAACRALPADPGQVRQYLETWFVPYLASDNGQTEGLFTGYYEAELKGSRKKHGPYRHPVHARPKDLVTADLGLFRPEWKGQELGGRLEGGRLVPYPDRNEIEAGALAGKGLEFLWVDDPVALFFMHIQGSGRVVLDDGGTMRIGYAARNGHPYRAIGAVLAERGAMPREAVTMPAIRAWIAAHPGEAAALMGTNPSYIFFRTVKGEGPVGAQGVALTPGRSLAVDRRFLPYGLPLWLDTTDPLAPERPLRRLMVAQDTGGAITGPVRGDIFWGHGREAEERAGTMRQKGRYFVLLPKSAAGQPEQGRAGR